MRGRRFGFVSAGVAVATMVSFGSLAVSPVVSSAGAAESVSRQAISPGDPVLPVSSVAVDPALTRLDLAGGTPAGGFSQAVVQYRASGAAVPRGRSAGLASSGSARPANQPALQPAATTFGAGTFPAPGVFLVPSQVVSTPSARREAAAAFDSGAGVDVLFGGRGTSTYFNDTWVFDGTNWVAKSPSSKPSTRQGSAMAYDPGTGRTILFGGQNGSTFDADTWSWNGTTWSHLSPATSPPPRRLAMMAYDPALGEIVLFGGVGSSGELGDTWTFDGSTWSQVSTSTAPSARANAGFGYDASGSDLVLYGGENGAGVNVLADTWTYTSSGWTQVSPAHDPGDRTGMGFAYDTTLGHLVLAGGTDGSNDHNDFWLWDGTDWQQGSLPDVPNPRHDYVLVPAPAGFGQLMAFGGISGSTVFSGTGVFDWGQLGTPKNATFITRPVDDRSSYGVNVANGNLVIAANDLSVPGVGIGFALQRRANGLAGYADWSGVGWELTNGFDTWWGALPDGSIVLSGVRGVADMLYFHKSGATFTTPPGVDATLATAGSGYTLTFNASSEKLTFNASGELTGDAGRNGNTITYSWSAGQPAGITDTQGRTYTVTLTSGLITRVTDTSGRHVDYTTTGGFLTQVVDGAGEITNYGYCGCGSLTGIEDPNANTTTLGHATDSRVSSITDPQTTPNETDFDYTAPDSAVSAAWVQTTVTDQNSHDTTYQVAYSGTPAKVTDVLGHSRSATYTPNGDVATAVDAIGAGNTTTFGYDALNNPISAQLPTGAETMAQYASGSGCSSSDTIHPYLVKCVEDAQGNQTTFSYDGPGNTLTQDNTATGVSLSYTYNPSTPTCGGKVGQLCSTTDGNSHTTNYHYDSAGDLTSISPAAPLGSISQTFDSLGRVATITDGNGATTTYSYDGDDRITQVLTNGASTCSYSAGTCVSYGYDDNGNQTSMHDVTGLTQYAFDVMNRQTTKTLPSLDTLTLGYDHAGNVTSYTDPGGTVVYGYNAANQLTSLAEPGGSCSGTISLCTSFGVNNNGARTSTTYPGNTVMTTTLDDSGRVSEIKAVNGSTTISDFTYSYTKTGGGDSEVTQSRTDQVAGLTTSYGYDGINELTSAVEKASGGTTTAAWTYCYDGAGNRTAMSTSTSSSATCSTSPTTSYSYDAGNELTALNGSSTGWSYDSDGNELAAVSPAGARTQTYNAANQTSSITEGGATYALVYAGLGNDQRVSVDHTVTTSYQYGPLGMASQARSGATTYFTRDPSGPLIAQRNSAHYYYIFDGQGSVVAIVNSIGAVRNTYSYDAYGLVRASTSGIENEFQYIGQYHDGTGLSHLGARYYDPTLGRFTQQDPTGQETNAYAYAQDNPTNDVDPQGTNAFSDFFTKNCAVLDVAEAGLFGEQVFDVGAIIVGTVALQPEVDIPAVALLGLGLLGEKAVSDAQETSGC